MFKIAKILHRALGRKPLLFVLSLLFFLLNGIATSSHNSIGITRTLLQTGEIERQVYLFSSEVAIRALGLVTGSFEVVPQRVPTSPV